jgi:hypothetical protein
MGPDVMMKDVMMRDGWICIAEHGMAFWLAFMS